MCRDEEPSLKQEVGPSLLRKEDGQPVWSGFPEASHRRSTGRT